MSFNPVNGLVYIPGQESSGTYTPDPNFVFHYGYRNLGMAMGLNGPRRPVGALTLPTYDFSRIAPAPGRDPAEI
jgi:hypothetical protein